jgi:hypothetical protein
MRYMIPGRVLDPSSLTSEVTELRIGHKKAPVSGAYIEIQLKLSEISL